MSGGAHRAATLLVALLALSGCDAAPDQTAGTAWIADEAALRGVAQDWCAARADDVDMLVVFGGPDTAPGHAFYLPAQNDVSGLGLPLFDESADFGSAGRLQGVVWVGPNWLDAPGGTGAGSVLRTLAHETAHRFGVALTHDDGGKQPSEALVGDPGHWSFFLASGASPLRGNAWTEIAPGRYEAAPIDAHAYADIDLYLMGLLSAADVAPLLLLTEPTTEAGAPDDRFRTWSARVSDTTRLGAVPHWIDIEDIIAVHGERTPDGGFTARDIRQAWLLEGGVAWTDDERAAVETRLEALARAWEADFHRATGGLGAMTVTATVTVTVTDNGPRSTDSAACTARSTGRGRPVAQ